MQGDPVAFPNELYKTFPIELYKTVVLCSIMRGGMEKADEAEDQD